MSASAKSAINTDYTHEFISSIDQEQKLMMATGFNTGLSDLLVQQRGPPAPRRKFKTRATATYVGLVACAIQDSPCRKLTFKQIMTKLEPYVFGDKKGIENNIRVCLSSNRCFVKVPVDPSYPNPKLNFWTVDERGITPKMFRRHFKSMAHLFPGLSAQRRFLEEDEENSCSFESVTPVCKVSETKNQVKFSGPFSIESLLKSDHEVTRMRSGQVDPHLRASEANVEVIKRNPVFAHVEGCFHSVSRAENELNTQKKTQNHSELDFGLYLPLRVGNEPRVLLAPSFMIDSILSL